MKTKLKTVLSVAVVSLMAATVMPTGASAEGGANIVDDERLIVQVNLGPADPDDENLCDGFSVLNVPNQEPMIAGLFQQKLGTANPTIEDVLDFYGDTIEDLQSPVDSTSEGIRTISYDFLYPEYVWNEFGEYVLNINESGEQQFIEIYSPADTNTDGVIDISPLADGFPYALTLTRRVFSTDTFSVSFDADDCPISEKVGILYAYREPLTRYNLDTGNWDIAELDEDTYFDPLGLSSSDENTGFAALFVEVSALNNLIRVPVMVADYPVYYSEYETDGFWGPYGYLDDSSTIGFGSSAEAQMRAGVQIIGNGSSGSYRVKFGYALEIFDFGAGGIGPGGLGGLECIFFGCGGSF